MTLVPLQDLSRRLSQQESELQALRRELERRQQQLGDLTRRKERLQAQLQQIDAQIATLVSGTPPARTAPGARKAQTTARTQARPTKGTSNQTKAATVAKKTPTKAASLRSATAEQISLPKLILAIVREASGPLAVRQLAAEALRRGFSTSSANFGKMIRNRVKELMERGMLRRIGDQGYVLRKPASGQKTNGQRPSDQRANRERGTAVPPQTSKASTRRGEERSRSG
jgi:hypothetical protein